MASLQFKVAHKILIVPLLMIALIGVRPAVAGNNSYWFDLLTEDVGSVQTFYQQLFGWTYQLQSSDYWLVKQGDTVVGGMMQIESQQANTDESLWLFALPVDHVENALEVAIMQGATVHHPVDTGPGIGRYAVILDPQGAPVTLRETQFISGPNNTPGQWGWAELWTSDVVNADLFYLELGNLQSSQAKISEGVYQHLSHNNTTWGGIVSTPFAGIKPIWVPYIVVEDVKQTVAKAESSGGTVLVPPQEKFSNGKVALLQDPSGAAFLIQAQDMGGEK